MAILGKILQTPAEKKRYVIDWSDWLDDGETIVSLAFDVTPVGNAPVVIDDTIDTPATSATLLLSGGDHGSQYEIIVRATTSGTQIKEDEIQFVVRDL